MSSILSDLYSSTKDISLRLKKKLSSLFLLITHAHDKWKLLDFYDLSIVITEHVFCDKYMQKKASL